MPFNCEHLVLVIFTTQEGTLADSENISDYRHHIIQNSHVNTDILNSLSFFLNLLNASFQFSDTKLERSMQISCHLLIFGMACRNIPFHIGNLGFS